MNSAFSRDAHSRGSFPYRANSDSTDLGSEKAIVFVDRGIENYSDLVTGVNAGTEVIILDPNRDGIEEITEILRDRHDLDSIHVVSHGQAGTVQLGTGLLSDRTLDRYRDLLPAWGDALNSGGDLLFYGCNFAASDSAIAFIEQLADLTGADLAASSDRTGNSALGGDWLLELTTGAIEAPLAFQQSVLDAYRSIFLPVLLGSGAEVTYLSGDPATAIDNALTLEEDDPAAEPIQGARVNIESGFVQGEDELAFDETLAAAANITGTYNADTGVLVFSGSASDAQYQDLLRSVTYRNSSDDPTPGERKLTFSIGPNTLYFSETGHFYEFVPYPEDEDNRNWTNAKALSDNLNLYGLQGYLATITSAAENEFVSSKLEGVGWLGGADRLQGVDQTEEGVWRWVTGPEGLEDGGKGLQFWQGDKDGNTVNDLYANWDDIEPTLEPNNDNNKEHFLHMLYSDEPGFARGKWNDFKNEASTLENYKPMGFVVEYGGLPGDPSPIFLSIEVTVNVINNKPPVLDASFAPTLTPIDEDATDPSGDRIADLLVDGAIADPDGTVEAIAVVAVDNSNGTWEYSLDDGQTWLAFGETLSESNAILLDEADRVRFLPDPDYNGILSEGLRFRAWDRTTGESGETADTTTGSTLFSTEIDTASLTVNPINDLPQVEDFTKFAQEEEAIAFTVTDFQQAYSDPVEGDPLKTLRFVSLPDNGTLFFNGNPVNVGGEIDLADAENLQFIPDPNWNGTTSFQWNGSDGSDFAAADATISLTVEALNDRPTVENIEKSANEDETIAFSADDFREVYADLGENTPLAKIVLLALPDNGTLSLNGNVLEAGAEIASADLDALVFIPNPNWNGTTQFNWNGSDGTEYATEAATVTIEIAPLNDPPTITGDLNKSGDPDTVIPFSPEDFSDRAIDADNDPLTEIVITSLPDNGTLLLGGNPVAIGQAIAIDDLTNLTFTPDPNWEGTTRFEWQVSDGNSLSTNKGTVNISVPLVPPNGAPIAENDNYSTPKNTALILPTDTGILANDRDPENESLTAILKELPTNGSLELDSDGSLVYTPNGNFEGVDRFTYRADDGTNLSELATVTITVRDGNLVPIAADDLYTLDEDSTLTLTPSGVLANDNDGNGDRLTARSIVSPSYGRLSFNPDGSFTYTPDPNFTGTDRFTYQANDGAADSNIATVTLTVNNTNDPPTANGAIAGQESSVGNRFSFQIPEGTFTDIDPGDTFTYRVTLANGDPLPDWLQFDPRTGTFSGTPGTGDIGELAIVIEAIDRDNASAAMQFELTVNPTLPEGSSGGGSVPDDPPPVITPPDGENPPPVITPPDPVEPPPVITPPEPPEENSGSVPPGIDPVDGGNDGNDEGTPTVSPGEEGRDLAIAKSNTQPELEPFSRQGGGFCQSPSSDPNCFCPPIPAPVQITFDPAAPRETGGLWSLGSSEPDTLIGGVANEVMTGFDSHDLLMGQEGDDLAFGDVGDDTLRGGTGSETPVGDEIERDRLEGGAGNDYINGNEGNDTIYSGSGDDLAHGGKDDDRMFGDRDDDTLYGDLGDDTMFGGIGSERPVGDRDDRDLLFGNRGNDILNGNQGDDTMFAGKDDDLAFGGKDDDWIWGDRGNDSVMGDRGNDRIFGGVSDPAVGDENGRDWLYGGLGDDFINGNESEDTICGGPGLDTVRGGKGDDLLGGYLGDDLLFGDLGNDTLCADEGNDTLYGGLGSDVAIGDRGERDYLCGGGGNDSLLGNEGRDFLHGSDGNDTIYGGKDDDTASGGNGDDWLFGDLGDDSLLGGLGSDRFVLHSARGTDTIADFEDGIDVLVLADGLRFEDLTLAQVGSAVSIKFGETAIATLENIGLAAIGASDFMEL
ncbi:tandem-95 repeat protein [Oxynema sp. CENA135]|uniref:tandem-95 repeat protein n=1 Tax=Oxynema sp. CENA135 TaxID=984206 RepID=UPI00190ADD4C|nr:Ig-like domain-containing protein [Oxynema sp. CENA135]MBK4731328.1 tandem-95 repeat protein [Oxynema sp. CENA135]